MTTNERFKKQVRARMAKTGEKYGAARRALLTRSLEPTSGVVHDGRLWANPPEVPNASVVDNTGRTWNAWCDLIDAAPGAVEGHQAVARWLADEHGLDGWWSQAVTIGWERITGRRVPGQLSDGSFAANKSKTMFGDAAALRGVVVDDSVRADLFLGVDTELRSVSTAKVLRLGMEVGVALLSIEDKGSGRMRVGIQHTDLPDLEARENWGAYWSAWLDDLAAAATSD
ncbi:MAG: DUF4287 domain-containing protein [Actinomycetota bacterium]